MRKTSKKQEVTFWLMNVVDRNVLGHIVTLTQIKQGDHEESQFAYQMERIQEEMSRKVKNVIISADYTSEQVRSLVHDATGERKYVHDIVVISASQEKTADLSQELLENSTGVLVNGLGHHYSSESNLFVTSLQRLPS